MRFIHSGNENPSLQAVRLLSRVTRTPAMQAPEKPSVVTDSLVREVEGRALMFLPHL